VIDAEATTDLDSPTLDGKRARLNEAFMLTRFPLLGLKHRDDLPPGPSDLAPVQLHAWLRHPIRFMEENAAKFGPTFTVRWPGSPPVVMTSDPVAIRDVFTGDADVFHAGEANAVLRIAVGENSLLLLDGPRHLRERKLMMPPFHGERMRSYAQAMIDITEREVAAWPDRAPFSFHAATQRMTLDVILRVVFGLADDAHFETRRETVARFVELGTSPVANLLMFTLPPERAESILRSAARPFTTWPLNHSPDAWVPWKNFVEVGDAVRAVLLDAIATSRGSGAEGRDVLSLLLSARDEQGQPMTENELHDEMLTLLLAGHETTATTLAWAMHELLRHPDVLARVTEEVRSIDEGTLADQAPKLTYLDAVIKETLRVHPVVPIVVRLLKQDVTVGGRRYPRDVAIAPAIYLAHHRDDRWPDPKRFDPLRFLDEKPDPYGYFPFGGGSRRCIGMAFSLFESKMMLATILRRTSLFAISDAPETVTRRGVTFAPASGVQVRRAEDPLSSHF
jgi:cytochrome P450